MKFFPSLLFVYVLVSCPNNFSVKAYAGAKSPLYSPSPSKTESLREKSSTTVRRGRDHAIIVRKTGEGDLSAISDLLAYESVVGSDASNWTSKMKKLKARSSFRTQILHRLQAAETATKVLSYPEHCDFLDTADERDTCRFLWSKDVFRTQLEKAAKTAASYEGTDTVWDNHNFNLQPSDPMMMNHIMMTAVDIDYFGGEQNCEDGCIVGFCEVAMLPTPSSYGDERCYAPCIANLVVSPDHRRRGIAARMIKNAERFVRLYWAETLTSKSRNDDNFDEDGVRSDGILGLYVDEKNTAATTLYLKNSFEISAHSTSVPGKLFLEKVITASVKD